MPKAWLQDRKRDYYYKKAKQDRYRSRATYKLLQAADKYHFIKEGNVVLDLGAAPGGWIQAARKIVGSKGFILGVDVKPMAPFEEHNIRTIVGDITDQEIIRQLVELLPGKADVVVSDLSPNISGIWEIDHARQIDLAENAFSIALQVLRPSGSFFVKVFQGDMFDDFVTRVKRHFSVVKVIKPKASRGKSSEMFILGIEMKQPVV